MFEQSLEISRRDGHQQWQGAALTCLGNVSRLLGDFEAARAYLDDAVSLTHDTGNRVGEAIALQGLGELLIALGDMDAAISVLERTMALHETLGDRHSHAGARLSLAAIAVRQADPARARTLYEQALRASLELGSRLHVIQGLEGVGKLSLLERNATQAARMLGAADAIRGEVHSPIAPSLQDEFVETITRTRDALGEDLFLVEWERGRKLTPEQAIEEVFGAESPARRD